MGKPDIAEHLRSVQEEVCSSVKIYVHKECRIKVLNEVRQLERHEHAESSDVPPKRRQFESRKSNFGFEWKKHCFICSRVCIDSLHEKDWCLCDIKRKDKRESTRCKIMVIIGDRTDEQSVTIMRRLSTCSDLPAVEARYHISCRKKLDLASISTSTSTQRGRPPNQLQADNFEKLCQWFEKECESYTVTELLEQMKRFANDPSDSNQVYSRPTYLKKNLQEKYGDTVFFAEVSGKSDVVCFKNNASSILNDRWYENRKSNSEEESERIIKTAAKLILMDLRNSNFDCSTYPTSENIASIQCNKENLPNLLRTFLESLLSNTLRQASIGQAIVYASRPRSTLPPILFGLAVELDHVFGSKWLLTQFNRFGFCLSSEEVLRNKQSVVMNENLNDLLKLISNGCFSQWSADNVDHNVQTIDGNGNLHGIGVIILTTGCNTAQFKNLLPPIPRQARRKAADIVTNHKITLSEYVHPVVAGLSTIRFEKTKNLLEATPLDINLDLLWHAMYFRHVNDSRPGWNGYMQHVTKGEHSGAAMVNMLPIIDLNPTDMTCIYSTLLFISQQAEKLNIDTPVVTFDQPLWIKAVEIVQASKMPIVLILGGFHMMMSFAGSIGTLMAGSGLSSALETSYGPISINHMLSGKAIAMSM